MAEIIYPTNVVFLLAEDFRAESDGKITIIGHVPGRRLKLKTQPTEKAAQQGAGLIVPSFGIMLTFLDGAGHFGFEASILDPKGNNIFPAAQVGEAQKIEDDAMNLVLVARPFTLHVGTYTVVVKLNDKLYEKKFEVCEE